MDLSSAFDNFVVNSVRKIIFFLPIIQFYLPRNTDKPHFVVVLVFVGKAHSFVLKMSSLEIFCETGRHIDPSAQTVDSQGYSEFDLREPIKFLSDVWVYLPDI